MWILPIVYNLSSRCSVSRNNMVGVTVVMLVILYRWSVRFSSTIVERTPFVSQNLRRKKPVALGEVIDGTTSCHVLIEGTSHTEGVYCRFWKKFSCVCKLRHNENLQLAQTYVYERSASGCCLTEEKMINDFVLRSFSGYLFGVVEKLEAVRATVCSSCGD